MVISPNVKYFFIVFYTATRNCASAFSTFQNRLCFVVFFSVLNGNFFFSLSFAGLVDTFITKFFFNIFSFSLPPDLIWGCWAKVWFRTRNTPARLGFVSLRILNHVSLGVDVPVFFYPGDVTSFSYYFS